MEINLDCKQFLLAVKQIVDCVKTEEVTVSISKNKGKNVLALSGSGNGTSLCRYLPDAILDNISDNEGFTIRIEILQKLLRGRKNIMLKHDRDNSPQKVLFKAPRSKSSKYAGHFICIPYEPVDFDIPKDGIDIVMNSDEHVVFSDVLKAVSLTPQYQKEDTILSLSIKMGRDGTYVGCGDAYHMAYYRNVDSISEHEIEFKMAQQTMDTIDKLSMGLEYTLRISNARIYASNELFRISTESLSTDGAVAFESIQELATTLLNKEAFASMTILASELLSILENLGAIFERGVPIVLKFVGRGNVELSIETNYGSAKDIRHVSAISSNKSKLFGIDRYTLKDLFGLVPKQILDIKFFVKDETGEPWVTCAEVPLKVGSVLYVSCLTPVPKRKGT